MKTSKPKNLKTLSLALALALAFASHAQEFQPSHWLETTLNVGTLFHAERDQHDGNLLVGYNRQYAEHASWGLVAGVGHIYSAPFEFDDNAPQEVVAKLYATLSATSTLRYTLLPHVDWTPRAYITLGFGNESYTDLQNGGTTLFKEKSFAFGFKPASFDINLGPHFAINLNVDLLDLYLRLPFLQYPDGSVYLDGTSLQLPVGHRFVEADRPVLSVGFRMRL